MRLQNHIMNMRKTVLCILATALVAAALSWGQSANNNSDARKQVLARLDEIQKAAEALAPEKVFGFVTENNDGAMISNGQLFLTRQDALDSTMAGFQNIQKVSYKFDRQNVTMLSPTTALAVGEGSSSATLSDGRVRSTRFAQTVVLVLTNGEWKVFHSHRSFPPAG
jgi:hypothetical protein